MRFDVALKKILATNVTLFGHLMQYFASTPGENFAFLASLCKVGYQNNFFLAKQVDNMEFMPGDEESAEADGMVIGHADDEDIIEAPQLKGPQLADSLSMAEFLKIVNTPDYPVVDIKEFLNGRTDKASDVKGSGGSPGGPSVEGFSGLEADWYNRIFGKPLQGLLGENPPRTDSPEDIKGEAGQ